LLLLSAIAEALNGSTHKKPTSAIPSSQRIIA